MTPMMQQYREAKERHPGMILLFRAGDFYELFHEDAEIVSRVLSIALTTRDGKVPMAGFPHHALEVHLRKLLLSGHRVAICDQVEEASQAKGRLIRREVTRVVTPGTLTDDTLLDPKRANHLVALAPMRGAKAVVGLAWAELSTGLFQAADVPRDRLADELDRLAPSECLVGEMASAAEAAPLLDRLKESLGSLTVTTRPDWTFDPGNARSALFTQFGVSTLAGFGFDDDSPSVAAAGALLLYLQDTLKSSLAHLRRLRPYSEDLYLFLDEVTRRSLELTRTLRDNSRDGSLLASMDRTVTAMGARLLAEWLLAPLANRGAIEARLESVAELLDDYEVRTAMREHLAKAFDLQRLTARVSTGRASPRDLKSVANTLALLPRIASTIAGRRAPLLCELEAKLELCPDLRETLESALVEDPPLSPREGGIFRRGYDALLDEQYRISTTGKDWIAQFQADEILRTGIGSLKVGYNQVFGYYIEVTNAHSARIPADYQRKQTLKNAERYITPALKEQEEKVLSATDKINSREYELFIALRDQVAAQTHRLLQTADVLSTLDVLGGLAELAAQRGYCRPTVCDEPVLQVSEGRHPVLDQLLAPGTFVPNDVSLGTGQGMFVLLTGPNMGGKCVTPDSLVFTDRGLESMEELKPEHAPIEEFVPLDRVVQGRTEKTAATHFYNGGRSPTIRVRTRMGFSLEGTPKHRIWVRNGDGTEGWKTLGDMAIGDSVALKRGMELWGSEVALVQTERPRGAIWYRLPATIDADLAYLFGLLIGDGSLTRPDNFRLCTTEASIAEDFRRVVREKFGYEAHQVSPSDYVVTSLHLRKFLADNGLGYSNALGKEVPRCIVRAPREVVVAFLQGLFDTDGTADNRYGSVSLSTSSIRLARQAQMLLLNLGMVASVHTKPTKRNPNYIVALKGEDSIRFHEVVGFRLERKRERSKLASRIDGDRGGVACEELRTIRETNYFYDQVEELTPGESQVYDLSVPHGNSYVANGFVSHNSVYLRQCALLSLMAQAGSFVPARSARIGLADRIFTRVGASDDLGRGHSTFMVEMTEAANILNNASPRSLVILDEIGRGTSTYDGVSLAWGITEFLHDRVGCRTLFATHYHELAELADRLTNLRNANVQVHEGENEIVFLHRVAPGSAEKSFGIHVAQRAGVPAPVLERARAVLAELEAHHLQAPARPADHISRPRLVQTSLFAGTEDPVLSALRELEIDELSAEEVVARVRALQRELGRG